MGNTLTNLIPTLYRALDVVSREMVGFIAAVTRNSSAERLAVGQNVTFPIVPAITGHDITPGQLPSDDGDATIGTATLTISKSRYWPVRWSGEEQKGVANTAGFGGNMLETIKRDQFAQAMRAAVNEVEADLAALYKSASRACGTAGTAPFGTANDLSDSAQIQKILDDNGAPQTDRHLVLGTGGMANLRGKQSVLFKVNEAGTEELLRRGVIGELQGLNLHTSAQVASSVTKGTGANYLVNNGAGYAVGDIAITVDTGAGTILAGDTITFAGDSNRYVVASPLAANVVTIAAPGLRQAVADNTAITVGNNFAPNMAFHRSALQLVTRAPAMPSEGDAADDVIEIIDPVSGLAFQIALYRLYRRVKYEVGLAWGVKAVKSEHEVILLG
ncbi:MAG TPA: P22 phage major capsid protein family protein [Blastocatellia bacterium]|jgi:hypothetical protein